MKVKSFSVKNYRSIIEAHKINLTNYNVLIGKNNEGKSNILRALDICMSCISNPIGFKYEGRREFYGKTRLYDWERDFPVQLRERKTGKNIIFKIVLELTEFEIKEFNQNIGTRLSSNELALNINIGADNNPIVSFPKKGTSNLTKKGRDVLKYLSNKILYNYIPSIRTKERALSLIKGNVAKELSTLKDNPDYIESTEKIKKIQNTFLRRLSKSIKSELAELLPGIKGVEIEIEDDFDLGFSTNDINVKIDDGVLTDIALKGDGINSLAVMAILKNKQKQNNIIEMIAIDEPEAHLHPGAIIELNRKLRVMAEQNQVIISTHNPTFIDVDNVSNNIVIDNGKAKPSKSIRDIREILGVEVEDYMISSKDVLLVEGKSDELIINKYLSIKSTKIKKALETKELVIKSMDSSSKLGYFLTLLEKELAKPIVLLDNDEAGKKSVEKVLKEKKIGLKDIFTLNCKGLKEAEIEDIINPVIYADDIKDKYGVILNNKSKEKWSKRVENSFFAAGKLLNEEIKIELKTYVAQRVLNNLNPFIEKKAECLTGLIERLEEILR